MANLCGGNAVAGLATRFPGLSSIASSSGEVIARLEGEEDVLAADVTLGGERGSGSAPGRARYWAAPMP
jgi:predicted amidohydrolase